MKKLIIAAALIATTGMFAQTVNDVPLKDIDTEYVQIVGTSKMLSTKLNINIDFGQKTKLFSSGKETQLKDSEGKKIDFNSMVDALNFMSENGYYFVNAYTVTASGQNVYHYILRKDKE